MEADGQRESRRPIHVCISVTSATNNSLFSVPFFNLFLLLDATFWKFSVFFPFFKSFAVFKKKLVDVTYLNCYPLSGKFIYYQISAKIIN